LDYAITKCIYC